MTKEVLKLALECAERCESIDGIDWSDTIDAIKEALAQPKREWVGLTEEEVEYPHPPAKSPVYATAMNTESVRNGFEMSGYQKERGYYSEEQLDEFAQAIEAELKVKNYD